jgi:long-chain acyl-CoA synthetase
MSSPGQSNEQESYQTGRLSVYAQKPWMHSYDYWVPETINYAQTSLYQILALASSLHGDKTATAFLGAEITYYEIKQQTDKLAAALSQLGIAKGDRVGIMLPNCPQYIIGIFAVLRLGAIVVNINPIYTPREVELVAKDSGMRALIAFETVAPIVLSVKPNSQIENVIITSLLEYSAKPEAAAPIPEGTLSFTDLIKNAGDAKAPRVEIDAKEDIAILQYTGGTTGVPKGAMITHHNAFANVLQIHMWGREFYKAGEGRVLLVIPC